MRITIQIALVLTLLSNCFAQTFYEYLDEPASLGSSGGINFYTMISGEVVSGWTDTNANEVLYYYQTTNGFPTIEDSSGNGNTGTNVPSGATGVTITNLGSRADGQGNELAGIFDGVDDSIRIPNKTLTHGWSEYSMTGWFKIKTYELYDALLCARGSSFNDIYLSANSSLTWLSGLASGGIISPNNAYTTNEWFHLAVTAQLYPTGSTGVLYMYVNGIQIDTDTSVEGAGLVQDDYFYVGWDDFNAGRHTHMEQDDLRIKNLVLSSNEVYTIYTNTVHPLGSIETRLTP